MVHPREADGVELMDVDAVGTQRGDVTLQQRLVVAVVAKAIEKGAHLHPLTALLAQQVEEQRGYAVVAEIEILEMDAVAGLTDGGEHIVELLLA